MFKELDPILHSQVRLAIMSLLMNVKSAEFSFLLENINTTKGNLSFQLTKLKEAEYIKKHIEGQRVSQARGKLRRLSRIIQAIEQVGMDAVINRKWSAVSQDINVATSDLSQTFPRLYIKRKPSRGRGTVSWWGDGLTRSG